MRKLNMVAPPFGVSCTGLDRLDEHLLRDVGLKRRMERYELIGERPRATRIGPPNVAMAAFAALCLVWGSTWVPLKIAVERVDPVTLAGTRFVAAGAFLLVLALFARGSANGARRPAIRPGDVASAALLSTATVCASYVLIFWSMAHLPSGLVAVVNLSLIPVGLYGFGLLFGMEQLRARRVGALPIGGIGLWLLMPAAGFASLDQSALMPLLACIGATFIYCLGAVASRPLVARLGPIRASGLQMLSGGLLMAPFAFATTGIDGTLTDLRTIFTDWGLFAAWGFLVLLGSVFGFTTYLRLLRDLGPARAGAYAYVSPIVALILGALLLGERVAASELLAAIILLTAAVLALGGGEVKSNRSKPVVHRLSARGT